MLDFEIERSIVQFFCQRNPGLIPKKNSFLKGVGKVKPSMESTEMVCDAKGNDDSTSSSAPSTSRDL